MQTQHGIICCAYRPLLHFFSRPKISKRSSYAGYHCILFQVVLTVSQIVWCRDISEILEGDFDRKTGMKEFETKNYQVGDFKSKQKTIFNWNLKNLNISKC